VTNRNVDATKKGNPTRRPYLFRGRIRCGYCERKMQGNWNNRQAYYRCRFPQEYALVNELDHPKVVYLREAEILEPIDAWLATAFAPGRIAAVSSVRKWCAHQPTALPSFLWSEATR
jgi:site-specific DNA recombinase